MSRLLKRGRAVISALETAVQLKTIYNVRVINLSLGRPFYESCTLDPLCQAVEAVWNDGIVVVAAAGNLGRNGYATVLCPGNSPHAITVGAMKTLETGTPQLLDFGWRSRRSGRPGIEEMRKLLDCRRTHWVNRHTQLQIATTSQIGHLAGVQFIIGEGVSFCFAAIGDIDDAEVSIPDRSGVLVPLNLDGLARV